MLLLFILPPLGTLGGTLPVDGECRPPANGRGPTPYSSGEPCETFVGILNSPPARLSREGGTQRRCEGPVPATLLFPLLALLFICGCVLGAFVPPAFEDE